MQENIQELWERLPKEPLKAFKAFQVYRDMGYKRDKMVVANRLGLPYKRILQLASKWKWEERIDAWEKHIDKIRVEAIKEEIKLMAQRHIQQALIFQRALVLPAEALLERIKPENDPYGENRNFEMLSFDKLFNVVINAAQTFGKAVDIERKARGEPDEISKLSINATETIRVILPKIVPPDKKVDFDKEKTTEESQ